MIKRKKLESILVKQQGNTDCGVACLATIMKFYGGEESLYRLRQLSGTTSNGTNLLGLRDCAIELGFNAKGVKSSIEHLKKAGEPCILHILIDGRFPHYVVFFGFHKDKAIIGDPRLGIEYWSIEELTNNWSTQILLKLLVTENIQFKRTPKSFSKKYEKLIQWIYTDSDIVAYVFLLGLVVAVLSLANIIFYQELIDNVIPQKSMSGLLELLAVVFIMIFAREVLTYFRSILLFKQSRNLNTKIVSSFFKDLLKLPKSFFDSTRIGELVARKNDARKIQNAIHQLIGNIILEAVLMVVYIAFMAFLSMKIVFLTVCFFPVYFIIIEKFKKYILSSQKSMMNHHSINESNYIDFLKGVNVIISSIKQSIFHEAFNKSNIDYQEKIFRVGKANSKFLLIISILNLLMVLSLTLFAADFVFTGNMELGSMIAILFVGGNLGPIFTKISLFNIQLQEAKVAFKRLEEVLSNAPNIHSEISNKPIEELSLHNVSFHYPGSARLLESISVSVEKGKIKSLLGEIGSGKSTITSLLLGLIKPLSGSIVLNGEIQSDYTIEMTGKKIGWIPQNIHIFNHNLLFNITMSTEKDEWEKAIEMCKKYKLDAYFNKFTNGLFTVLGESGSSISEGQKQIVGLARALYKTPDLLILDEHTSALDRSTERLLMNLLKSIKHEIGVFLVTHKFMNVIDFDQIYLLEKGRIIDSGNVKELVQRDNFLKRHFEELQHITNMIQVEPTLKPTSITQEKGTVK